ncbi:NAD+ kinase [Actinacidiphila yanglinensis]|uniref:NAD kinase n=1 Tax=Actinacidiphila yanglinensis TaxID=310779 RepID=A0A1H6DW78_9ACTN|nr:NAD(+)/NADH kinase [Actinacidiphila yanglinensis]SEG89587.1 NAD+ kinase [Actinacidiphila yanglinensis]
MIERIGLVVHGGKQVAVEAAAHVRAWADGHGVPCVEIDVWDTPEDEDEGTARRLSALEEAERAGMPDVVVTVGGDGTLLRGVRVAAAVDALVLGVDVGRVGFLTEVSVRDLAAALDAVHDGTALVDARLMLTMRASRPLEIPAGMRALLRYGRGPLLPPPTPREGDPTHAGWGVPLDVLGLNDVVFEKLARDRQASVAVYVEGRLFGYYSADAFVVASSTGSTAYSFAAGGPIISPHLDALVFTPVAPHMAFDRSLVLSAREQRVAVQVLQHSGRVAVSVDGRLCGVLDPGDWVTVYAARRRARLARLADTDFLGRVRDRFGLADAPAALADGCAPAEYQPTEPLPDDLAHPGPPDIH